ncbi:MAG: hypothetical protein WB445_10880, partial [Acinetobacter sp.]
KLLNFLGYSWRSLTVLNFDIWSSFCSFVSPKEPKAFVIRETCSLSALKRLSLQKQSILKIRQVADDAFAYQIKFRV